MRREYLLFFLCTTSPRYILTKLSRNSPGAFLGYFNGLTCDECRSALSIFQAVSANQDPTILNVLSEAYCLAVSTQPSFESCYGYLLTLK